MRYDSSVSWIEMCQNRILSEHFFPLLIKLPVSISIWVALKSGTICIILSKFNLPIPGDSGRFAFTANMIIKCREKKATTGPKEPNENLWALGLSTFHDKFVQGLNLGRNIQMSDNFHLSTLADPGGGVTRDAHSPLSVQISSISCSFWGKLAKIIGWCPHLCSWRTPLWEILDPPLKYLKSIWNFQSVRMSHVAFQWLSDIYHVFFLAQTQIGQFSVGNPHIMAI